MPPHVAGELVSTFDAAYAKAKASPVSVAATYIDAIAPWSAWEKWSKSNYPLTLAQRKRDYKQRYSSLKGTTAPCRRRIIGSDHRLARSQVKKRRPIV